MSPDPDPGARARSVDPWTDEVRQFQQEYLSAYSAIEQHDTQPWTKGVLAALREAARLFARVRDQAAAERQQSTAQQAWTCFHCGERFTTPGAARDHFGEIPDQQAGCLIDRVALEVGGTPERGRGLLMALRKAEADVASLTHQLAELTKMQPLHGPGCPVKPFEDSYEIPEGIDCICEDLAARWKAIAILDRAALKQAQAYLTAKDAEIAEWERKNRNQIDIITTFSRKLATAQAQLELQQQQNRELEIRVAALDPNHIRRDM